MTQTFARIALAALLVAVNYSSALAQLQILTGEGDFRFAAKHRVNAHGDEFNALARSSDGQRLFTGTEKGDIIVWNVTTNRLERTLHQPSGIVPAVHQDEARSSNSRSTIKTNHLPISCGLNVDTGVCSSRLPIGVC